MWDWLNIKVIGAVFGLIFGIIVIVSGFWQAVVVLICVMIGWLVTKFWSGEIDFIDWYSDFLKRRGKR